MPARFIFSLDCEGKWGVADHLDRSIHDGLAPDRLRVAYASLLELLDRYAISATFAFVGLFAEPESTLRRLAGELDDLAADFPDYLGKALADLRHGSRQGWCGDWALESVLRAKTPHEIAFHGVTHIPWDRMDAAAVNKELDLYRLLSSPVGQSRTMVFPRNRVAHVDRLGEVGLAGYRLGRHRSRVLNLLAEFNPFLSPEPTSLPSTPIVIPAGYFVNWQTGLRRLVPRSLGRARAANAMARAQDSNGVVHFWLHPENIASGPATLGRVEDVLRIVAQERDAGRCVVETQSDYCDRVGNRTAGAIDESASLAGGVAA